MSLSANQQRRLAVVVEHSLLGTKVLMSRGSAQTLLKLGLIIMDSERPDGEGYRDGDAYYLPTAKGIREYRSKQCVIHST